MEACVVVLMDDNTDAIVGVLGKGERFSSDLSAGRSTSQ
jgi:hypothetical protein